jgi:molybdopterin synthase catalytic subunit
MRGSARRGEGEVDLNRMIAQLREHPGSARMGMIASHLGVVRGSSLDGRGVRSVRVWFDWERVEKIVSDIRNMEGIVEILVEVCDGRLNVGQEIMAVAVAGDTREHVFPALIQAVDRIKSEASRKQEEYELPAEGGDKEK